MESAFKTKKDSSRKHPERDLAREKARAGAAAARAEAWRALTARQKLDELDRRLGVWVGAAKQRAKLRERLAAEASLPPPKADPIPEMTEARRKKKAKDRRADERDGLRPWGGR